jgi:transcriptional regulator with XRE-family HTH domain
MSAYPVLMEDPNTIDPVRVGFGMRLRAAREAVGLTQLDVGQRFGINKNTVSAWETGRGDPGVFRLMALSKLYKCSSESLLWENAPTNEAMQLAAEFDGLSARKQQTLRTLWLAFLADSKDDEAVESAMPITKAASSDDTGQGGVKNPEVAERKS